MRAAFLSTKTIGYIPTCYTQNVLHFPADICLQTTPSFFYFSMELAVKGNTTTLLKILVKFMQLGWCIYIDNRYKCSITNGTG